MATPTITLMKFKLNPRQHLQAYFGVRVTLFLLLLIMLVVFQPLYSRLVVNLERTEARSTLAKESLKEAPPEKLLEALNRSIEVDVASSEAMRAYYTNLMNMLVTVCSLELFMSVWLGVCLYQLNRERAPALSA